MTTEELMMEFWHRAQMDGNYRHKTVTEWLNECAPILTQALAQAVQDELAKIEALLPPTYYNDLPLGQRIQYLVASWRKANIVNRDLERQLEKANETFHILEAHRLRCQAGEGA